MADDRRSSGARTEVAAPTRGGGAPTGAPQIAPPPPFDGGAPGARTIGSYEIEGLLGEGGIGRVYAAHDRVLGRRVAIKTLRPELSRDRSFVERFYAEAKNLGHLNHPNITTVYAWHAEADDAFMVMELVLGYTLDAMLAREHRFSLRDSLAVLVQAAAGIGHAHRMGIVHRDLKPANLMVTHEGAVKIMDFGIARVRGSEHLTRVGDFCGTFLYASPEQIRGEEVDERSDLYSLAIVFYRLLAGHPPFTSNNEYALMTAQLQEPPPPLLGEVPGLDAATQAVVMRALAKRPEDRFASVEEFARAAGAMALRGESADILQQLCARIFGEENPEPTRIATPPRLPTAEAAPPPLPAPAAPASRVVEPEPPHKPAIRERIAASPAAIAPAAPPPAIGHRRHATRRPWLIGGGVLALPLLVAAYYLAAGGGPTVSSPPGSGSPAAASAASPAAPSEGSPPEQEVQSLPTPAPFETTKLGSPPAAGGKAAANPAAERTAADAAAAPPAGGEAATTTPPAAATQGAAPPPVTEAATPATTAPGGTQGASTPPVTEAATPAATAPDGTRGASTPPVTEAATPAAAAPGGTQVASTPPGLTATPPAEPPPAAAPLATPAPQPPSEPPPATAPEATAKPPTPEGEPDLQGRVTGVKGLNEIELDKSRWIRIFGIVDRARGGAQASQHVEALKRYLKPSQNHLVCYHKEADTYRCYSDGQDVARLALHDRLVQLAPNAPREYRELLSQRP